MFRAITILSSVALMCAGASVFFGFVQSSDDEKVYEQWIKRPSKQIPQTTAHQVRTNVQKDLWTADKGHVTLKSHHSDLWIEPRRGKFHIIETLDKPECCQHEKEETRWLTAKEGTFSYPELRLEATDVHLQMFSNSNAPTAWIKADRANWLYPETLHLTGNVQSFGANISKEPTFALADELLFHPKTKRVELRSHSPQKVLFWQNDLHLSSPAIEIRRNEGDQTEQIKGLGDVHVTFTGEEKELFYKIFGIKIL